MLLERFKRKALRSKSEVFSILVGTIVKENDRIVEVRIEGLVYPPQSANAAGDEVVYNTDDFTKLQARILPKQIIGTLHSHPNITPCISKEDIDSAAEFGEIIIGIFSYWVPDGRAKRVSQFDWYSGVKPLEIAIIDTCPS